MTRPNSSLPSVPASTETPSEIDVVHVMMRYLRMAYYRKGVLIVVLAVSCLLGGLHYATATRRYESTASLLILQTGDDAWSTQMAGERVSRDLMPTYQSLIRSEAVLEEAVKLLPEEARIDMGDKARDGWPDVLHDNLSVSVQRGTNILEIAYRSANPQVAASVVSSVVAAYLKYMEGVQKNTGRELLDILTKQKASLEEELRAKESELAETRASAGELVLGDGEQGVNVVVKRALSLNEAMIKAHEKRLEAQTQLVTIEAAIRNGSDLRQLALSMVDEAGNEALLQQLGLSSADGGTLARLKQQLVADAAALQTASQLYGPAHQKVREIQQRIQVTQQYLDRYHENAMSNLQQIGSQELVDILHGQARQRLDQAIEHENAIAASYDQEKRRAIDLDRYVTRLDLLDHDLERLRNFYDVVLDRIKNIDMGQDAGAMRASVISQPEVPRRPVTPQLRMTAVASILFGLLAGLGLIYILDVLDDRFRSPEDLQLQLRISVLAMVRKLDPLEGDGVRKLHVVAQPNGSASEAFRTLRTALALTGSGAKSFVVSSAEPGDGKTTTMANLAAAFAQTGQRTLLIDGDMRRPGLTTLLDLRGPTGLATVLRDDAPITESAAANLETTSLENLDVLPSGPRQTNSMQLLASERFSELLSWADSRYDQILVDAPPALAVSDAAMIGRLVDGVLLVVRPEKNRRRTVIRAVEQLHLLGVNVLGTVLNHLAPEKSSHYYGYGYGYGYNYEYGGGYGHDESEPDGDPLKVQDGEDESRIRPRRRSPRKAA